MSTRAGFWSYAHDDDAAEQGRVRLIADDLAEQYALISGDQIKIFVDRKDLAWGDDWREKIDAGLASGLFFIPIITPRFFQRTECRRELQAFVRSAESLGVRELILPLLYVDVPALGQEAPGDEAIDLVKKFQWEDWRDLRFEERASGAYRRGVARLAQRLVDASQELDRQELSVPSTVPVAETSVEADEEPGMLDLVAGAMEALPKLAETIGEIGPEAAKIGSLLEEATVAVKLGDSQGKGFAARLTVSKRLGQDLSDPANRIFDLANSYTALLYEVDRGIFALIQAAPASVQADPSELVAWNLFAQNISALATVTSEGMKSARNVADTLEQIEAISKDLRPPTRKIRQALTILIEGSTVMDEWKRRVDETTDQINSSLH